MPPVKIPEFEVIAKLIDWDKVSAAIPVDPRNPERTANYAEEDLEDIKSMIWSAAEKWLPRDLVEFKIHGLEERHNLRVDEYEIKGFYDLEGMLLGQLKPYDEYKYASFILDWKTTEGELDTRWRNRQIDSWQWKIYAAMSPSVRIFNYRGISRREEDGVHATKDIILEVPSTNDKEVKEFVQGVNTERDALIAVGLGVWPRNMPDACNKYGRVCPFKDDCDMYSMPRWVPPLGKVMSHTTFSQFLLCPEKHRRLLQAPSGDEDEAHIGPGFHNGIAELYRQAKEIKLV